MLRGLAPVPCALGHRAKHLAKAARSAADDTADVTDPARCVGRRRARQQAQIVPCDTCHERAAEQDRQAVIDDAAVIAIRRVREQLGERAWSAAPPAAKANQAIHEVERLAAAWLNQPALPARTALLAPVAPKRVRAAVLAELVCRRFETAPRPGRSTSARRAGACSRAHAAGGAARARAAR